MWAEMKGNLHMRAERNRRAMEVLSAPAVPITLPNGVMSGHELVEWVQPAYTQMSSRLRESLFHSNTLLTFAGIKPSTTVAMRGSRSQLGRVNEDVRLLAQHAQPLGIEVYSGAIERDPRGKRLLPIWIANRPALERVTSVNPLLKDWGITRYQADTGVHGWDRWVNSGWQSLRKAGVDEHVAGHVMTGIVLGFPMEAIKDSMEAIGRGWHQRGNIQHWQKYEMVDIRMQGTGIYEEAEPNWHMHSRNLFNPRVQEMAGQSAEILRQFYTHPWHREVSPLPIFRGWGRLGRIW